MSVLKVKIVGLRYGYETMRVTFGKDSDWLKDLSEFKKSARIIFIVS